MNKNPLKLGFIGGGVGSIAGYAHYTAAKMDGRFELVAGIFSQDQQNNHESAILYNVKNIFSTQEEFIEYAKNSLDVVSILTPTPSHAPIVLELIKSGVNIICEKALSATLNEALLIQNALIEHQTFLAVTYNYSGFPMVRELKARIQSGELGKIYQIRIEMPQESFVRPPKSVKYPQKWRLHDSSIPTICLDLGVHLHHLAYFLADFQAKNVFARMNQFSKYGVIDDVEVLMEDNNGIQGSFWMSKVALGNRNGLKVEIYGDSGSAVWVQEEPEKLKLSYKNGDKKIIDRGSETIAASQRIYNRMTPGHPSGFLEAFANIYFDIADSLTSFNKNKEFHLGVFDVQRAVDGLKLFHAARLSHEEKRWIEV